VSLTHFTAVHPHTLPQVTHTLYCRSPTHSLQVTHRLHRRSLTHFTEGHPHTSPQVTHTLHRRSPTQVTMCHPPPTLLVSMCHPHSQKLEAKNNNHNVDCAVQTFKATQSWPNRAKSTTLDFRYTSMLKLKLMWFVVHTPPCLVCLQGQFFCFIEQAQTMLQSVRTEQRPRLFNVLNVQLVHQQVKDQTQVSLGSNHHSCYNLPDPWFYAPYSMAAQCQVLGMSTLLNPNPLRQILKCVSQPSPMPHNPTQPYGKVSGIRHVHFSKPIQLDPGF
jgi:hypothetical protein